MADAKISALTELAATPAADDYLPIVDASEVTDGSKNKRITVDNLFAYNTNIVFVPLTTPLTSTDWDGDSYSTTAKTKIDLSAVFNAPAGIKAALIKVDIRDSGSASNDRWFMLSPNDTVNQGLSVSAYPVNDRWARVSMVVPCDANGDVYFQNAAGDATMDVFLEIWGYWL